MWKILIGLLPVVAVAVAGAAWWSWNQPAAGDEPRVPANELGALLAVTSPEQQAALADGVVTEAEYANAVNGTAACLRAQGVAVEGPSPQGRYLRLVYSAPGAEEMARARALYQDCFAKHEREISQAWTGKASAYEPPTGAQRDSYWAQAVACFRAGGLDVPAEAAFHQVAEAAQARANSGNSAGELILRCNAVAARAAGLAAN